MQTKGVHTCSSPLLPDKASTTDKTAHAALIAEATLCSIAAPPQERRTRHKMPAGDGCVASATPPKSARRRRRRRRDASSQRRKTENRRGPHPARLAFFRRLNLHQPNCYCIWRLNCISAAVCTAAGSAAMQPAELRFRACAWTGGNEVVLGGWGVECGEIVLGTVLSTKLKNF